MVFAPFLECCGDAVMFAKQNAALDDDDDCYGFCDCIFDDEVAVVGMK